MKKELIDLITPIILDIQAKRKLVTDEVVAEFMRPRKLNWSSKQAKVQKPQLSQEQLSRLNSRLEERSYLAGYEFSTLDESVAASCQVSSDLPHLSRWKRHVQFLVEEGQTPSKVDKQVAVKIKEAIG